MSSTRKTFLKALKCYPDHLPKMRDFLLDKRLSEIEKKIIRSWLQLRDREYSDIIENLSKIKSNDSVVESQREILLGIALNNSTKSSEAVPHLERAIKLLESEPLPREKFIAYNNLFVVFLNLNNLTGMEKILDYLEEVPPYNKTQEIEYCRIKFNYFSKTGNNIKVKKELTKLETLKSFMNESQLSIVNIDKFIYFVKQLDFDHSQETLDELKFQKKYISYSIMHFFQSLLNFIQGKSKLYLYPKDFNDSPIILEQVKFLLAMESGDNKTALISWNKLREYQPVHFHDFLDYKGDRCLFSLALKKIVEKNNKPTTHIQITDERDEYAKRFTQFISMNNGLPVSKEAMYEYVYGERPNNKEDFNKLFCVIKRMKKKYGLNIITRKGAFQVIEKESA